MNKVIFWTEYDENSAFDEGYIFDERKNFYSPKGRDIALYIRGYGDKNNLGKQISHIHRSMEPNQPFAGNQ